MRPFQLIINFCCCRKCLKRFKHMCFYDTVNISSILVNTVNASFLLSFRLLFRLVSNFANVQDEYNKAYHISLNPIQLNTVSSSSTIVVNVFIILLLCSFVLALVCKQFHRRNIYYFTRTVKVMK